jgi:hypothetical protein
LNFLPEGVDQLRALAIVEPGILLAAVEAERRGAEQRPGRVLADIVIVGGMAHLDGAVLHGVEHLQCGYDLAGSKARIWNLPSVASETYLEIVSQAP